MTEHVGIREAARQLGIKGVQLNASTVSRFVKDHPELNHGTDKRPKIDIAEFMALREMEINPLMSDNHAGGVDAAGDNAIPATTSKPNLATAKTVGEAAKAQMARLDLAERLGQVIETGMVEATIAEAGQALVQAMEGRNRRLGDELATMSDPRAIAARLKESDREVLEKVSDALNHAIGTNTDKAAAA